MSALVRLEWLVRMRALTVGACLFLTGGAGGLALAQDELDPTDFLGFATDTFRVSEGDATVSDPSQAASVVGAPITLFRLGQLEGAVLVDLVLTPGLNTQFGRNVDVPAGWPQPADPTASVTNTVLFSEGQSMVELVIPVIDDPGSTNASYGVSMRMENARPDPDDDPSGPTPVPEVDSGSGMAQLIISSNDEEGYQIERMLFRVPEGATNIVIGVNLLMGGTNGAGVTYYTTNTGFVPQPGSGFATPDEDYTPVSGLLTFGQDEFRQLITIPILDDNLAEFREDFQLVLTDPIGEISITNTIISTNTDPLTDEETLTTNEVVITQPWAGLSKIVRATITILSDDAGPGAVSPDWNPSSVRNPTPGANNAVYDIALQSDGFAVLAGDFTAVNARVRNRIARVDTNGLVDLSFMVGSGADNFINDVDIYRTGPNAGKIVFGGGFNSFNGEQRKSVGRLQADGTLDPSFDPRGGANGPVYAVAVEPSGSVLIGGDFTSVDGIQRNRLARLGPDGLVDDTFNPGRGPNGPIYVIQVEGGAGAQLTVTNAADAPSMVSSSIDAGTFSGNININYRFGDDPDSLRIYADNGTQLVFDQVLTNDFTVVTNAQNNAVTNFLPASLNVSWSSTQTDLLFVVNEGSTNQVNGTPFGFTAEISPDTDAGIIVGGDFTEFNGKPQFNIARVNDDGTLDTSYARGRGTDGPVYALAAQPAGKVVVGGAFDRVNNVDRASLARLNSDGSLDRSFDPGFGVDGSVFDLDIDDKGRILVGGAFTSYDLVRRLGVARIFSDGVLDTSFMDRAMNQHAGLNDPGGFVSAIVFRPENGNVLVGGLFEQFGGGQERDSLSRQFNYTELVGGEGDAPGNVLLPADQFSFDENADIASIPVERTNGTLGDIIFLAVTLDGLAMAGVDYSNTVSVVGFENNGTNLFILEDGAALASPFQVPLIDDTLVEGNETFNVELLPPFGLIDLGGVPFPTGPALARRQTTVTIVDNDFSPGTISLTEANYFVNEGTPAATLTLVRTNGTTGAVTVDVVVSESPFADSATGGVDFLPKTATVSFAPGQTERTVTVTILDDNLVEMDESILVRLVEPRGGVSLGRDRANVIIVDDDFAAGRIAFVDREYEVDEKGERAVIRVKRAGGNVGVLSVQYASADGTATAPFDYADVGGTISWNDGEIAVKSFTVPISNDGLVEGDETVLLTLSNPSIAGALGNITNATLTIVDDDFFGVFGFAATNYVANENGGTATVVVNRRDGSAETATVDYATEDGTAVAGQDYLAQSGTLIFGVGETSKRIEVPLLDNAEMDGEKMFQVKLSNPGQGQLGEMPNTVVRIADDEAVNAPAGAVDATFRIGDGADGPILSLAIQENGRILAGGDFSEFNLETRQHLVRLQTNGLVDASFSDTAGGNGVIRDIDLQGDGRILIGGRFTQVQGTPKKRVARLIRTGNTDTTFNVGAGADGAVHVVNESPLVDANGNRKIYLGGNFNSINGVNRPNVARLNFDGTVDSGFFTGSGPNGQVYAIVIQRDGRVLIGGDFTMVDGIPRRFVARLNADGSVDQSFDAGLGADGAVRALAIQPDDKILLGGAFTTVSGVGRGGIARLTSDGALDATFQPGSGVNGSVFAITLQNDGRILLGGEFTHFNGLARNRIARLRGDGSIDTSINFGSGANGFVSAIAIQDDRKILVAGGFTEFNGVAQNHITRLHGGSIAGAGSLEFAKSVFEILESSTNAVVTVRRAGGLTGEVSVDFATSAGTADAFGDYQDVNGTLRFASGESIKTFVVPVNDDALPEPEETVNLSLSNVKTEAGIQPMAVLGRQPQARLKIISDDSVLSFTSPSYTVSETVPGQRVAIGVTRIGESSTSVSVSYRTSGGTATAGRDYASTSGTLVFAPGQTNLTFLVNIIDDSEVEDNETVELTLFGPSDSGVLGQSTAILTILDNDFAPGILSLASPSPALEGSGLAVVTVNRASGKSGFVTVDFSTTPNTATPGEDYTPVSGTLAFADGETSKSISIPIVDDSEVEGNETFIVTISNPSGGAQIGGANSRLVPIVDDELGPGSLDETFATGGGANGPVISIALQPDGKILAAGAFTQFNGNDFQHLVRLNTNGAIDFSFLPGSGPENVVYAIEPAPNGKVAVGGEFLRIAGVPQRYAGRLATNGFPDALFQATAGLDGPVLDVQPQPDEKIVVAGAFTAPAGGIARLNKNGTLDVGFNPDQGTDGVVYDVALQADGKIILGGDFSRIGRIDRSSLGRLHANGLLDESFASEANGPVFAVLVEPDGRVLIAGDFTTVNGVTRTRVARLNSDGTLDTAFGGGAGPNGPVVALGYRPNGKIFIGGHFTSVSDEARNRVARLHANGSLDEGFNPGRGPNGPVLDLAVQSDGQLLIAGDFTSVNGFMRNGIARLNDDPASALALQIESVTVEEEGQVTLLFATDPGSNYEIQGSANLLDWTPLGKVIASEAVSSFTDVSASDAPYRFYRIVK